MWCFSGWCFIIINYYSFVEFTKYFWKNNWVIFSEMSSDEEAWLGGPQIDTCYLTLPGIHNMRKGRENIQMINYCVRTQIFIPACLNSTTWYGEHACAIFGTTSPFAFLITDVEIPPDFIHCLILFLKIESFAWSGVSRAFVANMHRSQHLDRLQRSMSTSSNWGGC